MPRRVPGLVYWILHAGVWMLWVGALKTVFGWGRPAGFAAVGLYLWFLVAAVGKSVFFERKAAKREGRTALGIRALARRTMELPAVPRDLSTVNRFLFELIFNAAIMLAVSWPIGHGSLNFSPVALALLAAYCLAKLWVPSFADAERSRHTGISGADAAV